MNKHLSIAEIQEKIAAAIHYKKTYLVRLLMKGNGVMACVEFDHEADCYIITRGNGTDVFCKTFDGLNKLLVKIHPSGFDPSSVPIDFSIAPVPEIPAR